MKHLFSLFLVVLISISQKSLYAQTPGTPDTSFNGTGRLAIDIPDNIGHRINPVAIDDHNRVYVLTTEDFNSYTGFFVRRYFENGTIDNSFGTEPGVFGNFGGDMALSSGVALQADGKVLVWGTNEVNSFPSNQYSFAIARFDSTGAYDLSFGINGIATLYIPNSGGLWESIPNQLYLYPDGKILLTGTYGDAYDNNSMVLMKFLSDGTPDSTFDSDGVLLAYLGFDRFLIQTVVQPGGEIISSTNNHDLSYDGFDVRKFQSDGSADPGFGSNGLVSFSVTALSLLPFTHLYIADLLSEDNGNMLLYVNMNWHYTDNYGNGIDSGSVQLWELNPNGGFNSSYGINGRTDVSSLPFFKRLVLQPDQKILGAVNNDNDFSIMRMDKNGNTDESFGANGFAQVDFPDTVKQFRDLWMTSDEKIVAVCSLAPASSIADDHRIGIERFNTNEVTGIHNPNEVMEHLTLFPNPSSGKIYLQFDLAKSQPVVVDIENLTGGNTHFEMGKFAAGKQNLVIKLPDSMMPGLYVCKVSAGNDLLLQKFVLSR